MNELVSTVGQTREAVCDLLLLDVKPGLSGRHIVRSVGRMAGGRTEGHVTQSIERWIHR